MITGSSPSGTFPASNPTANTTLLRTDSPAPKIASGTNAIASATATPAISHATRRTCRSSGLGSSLTRSDSAAIRPSSVCMPVAKTTTCASPPVHVVPLNTRSRASSRGTPIVQLGRAQHRHRLTGERREIDLDIAR